MPAESFRIHNKINGKRTADANLHTTRELAIVLRSWHTIIYTGN